MFEKAKKYQQDNTKEINHIDEFKEFFKNKKTNGFAWCHFCGDSNLEKNISEEFGATIRLIPIDPIINKDSKCIFTGKDSKYRVLFAKSY